jgi:hypothetical protein
VTEKGTQIPLGTTRYVEDGLSYSCKLNFQEKGELTNNKLINTFPSLEYQRQNATEASGSGDHHVPECDFLAGNGRSEYHRGGYAISCLTNQILGCIDVNGDLVRSGQLFVSSRGLLHRCVVYGRGRWAKMEQKGKFCQLPIGHWPSPSQTCYSPLKAASMEVGRTTRAIGISKCQKGGLGQMENLNCAVVRRESM